jgi:hypothetical protein
MEPKSSLPYSQKPTTDPCPESNESTSYSLTYPICVLVFPVASSITRKVKLSLYLTKQHHINKYPLLN